MPACPSIPLGQRLTPAPFSDESLWTLHLCLLHPTDGIKRDRLLHCLDIFQHLSAWGRCPDLQQRALPVNPAGLKLMIRSVTCFVVSKISKAEQAAWRDTEKHTESHSGSTRTWRLWFEIQSERPAALRHMTVSLWIQCHYSSNTSFTLSAHQKEDVSHTQADIYAGRR